MAKKLIATAIFIVLLIVVGAIFYELGDVHAVQAMTIRRASPAQLAKAMQADNFYSDFRRNTLVVTGQVLSVSIQNDAERVTFKSNTTYKTSCSLADGTPVPPVNSTVTLIAEGGPAQRLSNGVLLVDCVNP